MFDMKVAVVLLLCFSSVAATAARRGSFAPQRLRLQMRGGCTVEDSNDIQILEETPIAPDRAVETEASVADDVFTESKPTAVNVEAPPVLVEPTTTAVHEDGNNVLPYSDDNLKAASSFNFVANFFRELLSLIIEDEDVLDTMVKLNTWFVWCAVLLSILGTFGVDTKPLLSLLGITGITIGVALKDQISEAIAGLGLAFFKPFSRGSLITIPVGTREYSGRVMKQTLRHVKLYDAASKSYIILPVTAITKAPLTIHDGIESQPLKKKEAARMRLKEKIQSKMKKPSTAEIETPPAATASAGHE